MLSQLAFLLLFLFCSSLSFAEVLTDEEQIYIRNNPTVLLGGGEGFAPLIYQNAEGELVGYDRDVADLIEKETGLEIHFVLGNWNKIQHEVKQGRLDGMSAISSSRAREDSFSFTSPYFSSQPVVVVSRANPKNIQELEDLHQKVAAVQLGNIAMERMTKSLGDIEIVYFEHPDQVLKAVAENTVDFAVKGESLHFVASRLGLEQHITTKFVLDQRLRLNFAFGKNNEVLTTIFNKAIENIGQFKLRQIKEHWFHTVERQVIELSQSEKEYLYQKKSLSFCVHPNWYPFESIETEQVGGMTSDFISHFQNVLGLPFEVYPTQTWGESLSSVAEGLCDILPMAMQTPSRSRHLSFTAPYIKLALVLATREDVQFIDSLEDLKGKSIGIFNNTAYSELLKERDLEINLIQVNDVEHGLKLVSKGVLFGMIDALPAINHYLQTTSFNDLKISGRFDEKWQLSLATSKGNTELFNILNKLVKTIDNDLNKRVLNKYISVRHESYLDTYIIYRVIAGALLVIAFFIWRDRKIKKESQLIKGLYQELRSKDEKLQQVNKELELLSYTDTLTGIGNRRMLDIALLTQFSRCKNEGVTSAVVLFDIDYFKLINDTFGHQVGDEFLIDLTQTVEKNIRHIDIFGRWGGEEFLLILPNCTLQQAMDMTERLRTVIESTNFKSVGKRTVSFGIAKLSASSGINFTLRKADNALYEAKERGRNCVSVSLSVENESA
ncbi:hypothetical protein C9J01_22975 [Photobacterium rosenbergii]|uniref:diguanylate cyclase n=1 Tax=Photobacterium rosenbergii TaxID=294936 RepID=A0A2T3N770_9GAMM|nr:transporter substrate-binding domain-containing protein [Photobacterium rosenbergii]PSW08724.1 hypothetical protein C9J01_22975 [Photobacterium rosenbergii]